jgi:hypothetical protein
MSTRVVCLDPLLGVLHLPGPVHATTACGIDWNQTGATVTFGPEFAVGPLARERCTSCFGWRCPRCGMTSHHPMDAYEGYCGNCHDWTEARQYRLGHYDRQGRPISMRQFAELLDDVESRRVGYDNVEGLEVSTVLMSMDLNFTGQGPPLIFETVVFDHDADGRRNELYCERYATAEGALAGHDQAVEWAKAVARGKWPAD